jgi:hypothetical protein
MKKIYLVEEHQFWDRPSLLVKAFVKKCDAKKFINTFPSRAPRRIEERYKTKWRRLFSIRSIDLE